MTRLVLRLSAFVVSAAIALCSLATLTAAALLTMSPPVIDSDAAETIRTWGVVILALSAIMALSMYDQRWFISLRNFFSRKKRIGF